MRKLILILLVSTNAHAMDYDVEWPRSNSKEHVLLITIDNCKTEFKVKTEDLDKFANSHEALKQAVDLAMEHTNNGCK
jgi:CO dehydrogenase/acetyl-CoA synthase delta subunit